MKDPTNFREYAGTLAAFILVMAYASIGFVQLGIWTVSGSLPPIPSDWNASMLTLAGGALGFLVGKQTTAPPPPVSLTEVK